MGMERLFCEMGTLDAGVPGGLRIAIVSREKTWEGYGARAGRAPGWKIRGGGPEGMGA